MQDQRGNLTYDLPDVHIALRDPTRGMIPNIPVAPGVTAWRNRDQLDRYFDTEIFDIDPHGFPYIYGEYLVPGILHAVDELSKNPNSRRIVIPVGEPDDMRRPNPACLRIYWLRIIQDHLFGGTYWRSRDFAGGWATNAYGMVRLLELAADELGLPVGSYSDISASGHIYAGAVGNKNDCGDIGWVKEYIL